MLAAISFEGALSLVQVPHDESHLAGRSQTALGRGRDVVSFQNIGHGLVAHFMPEITQRTHNPPISPSAILSRQLQDQFFDLIAPRAAFTG